MYYASFVDLFPLAVSVIDGCGRLSWLWGDSKGAINFPWICLWIVEFSPFWALQEYIQTPIHLACLRVFSVTPWVIVYRFIAWDDKDKVIGFKTSHWIHPEWRRTGSPKLQLFQLSQHLHVISCRLISFSANFPWNMTLKYKIHLPEGSWDNILHSKSRTQCFSKEDFFLAVCLSKRYIKVPEVVFATSL